MRKLSKKMDTNNTTIKAFWGKCTCYCRIVGTVSNSYSMYNGTGY